MNVIVSTRARRELFEIGEWIKRDNPDRAQSYVDELYEACRSLGDLPLRFPPAPEFGAAIRKRTHRNYLILYRVGLQVTIVAVRHAARDRGPLGRR